MCIMSGIAVSSSLGTYMRYVEGSGSYGGGQEVVGQSGKKSGKQRTDKSSEASQKELVATVFVSMLSFFLVMYAFHCVWAVSEAYSSPSIVLTARGYDGSRIVFDDFREAYWWLRHNTPEDSKIMSWWDYGYQISSMANRTILVDNNTWNNTHISRVGQAMASSEEHAYEIMKELDVDYVLVIFGGVISYSSDGIIYLYIFYIHLYIYYFSLFSDINKFLWMVRIAGSTEKGAHIHQDQYFSSSGQYRVDSEGSSTMLGCLMYKLCYYRFGQLYTEGGKPSGYDRVRQAEIGNKDFQLDVVEEAYTTEHWLVRIYKVKDMPNRGV